MQTEVWADKKDGEAEPPGFPIHFCKLAEHPARADSRFFAGLTQFESAIFYSGQLLFVMSLSVI